MKKLTTLVLGLSAVVLMQAQERKKFIDNDMIVISESNNLTGSSMSLISLDNRGNILFDINVTDEIENVSFGRNCIFALGNNYAFVISKDDSGSYSLNDTAALSYKYNYSVVDTDNNFYLINNPTVERLDF